MNLRPSFTSIIQRRLLMISIIAAAVVIHTPPQRLQYWGIDFPAVHLVRGLLFFLSVGYLFFLIAKPIIQFFVNTNLQHSFGSIALDSFKVFGITALLIFPSTLGIMGVGYAYMSISPFIFVDASDQLYQRLLMPVLAYALHLRGPELYHFFSLVITFCTLFLLQIFFLQKKVILSTLEYVSIATSSFIITQFHSPGYTEALSFLFVVLLLIVKLDEIARVALFALCLFAHEGSVLLLMVISVVFFSKRELGWIIVMSMVYGLIWLTSFGFDVKSLLAVRTVGNYNTLEWIINYPFREILGIIFSFKILWFFMIIVLYTLRSERGKVILLLLPGIVLTFLAVDTTRMAGFAFAALLYSILVIKQQNVLSAKKFKFVCALNLCLPAVYVGVNAGVVYFDGLYQLLQFGLFFK